MGRRTTKQDNRRNAPPAPRHRGDEAPERSAVVEVGRFETTERLSFGRPELPPNRLIRGDNLKVMRCLPGESVDFLYADPPFFTGRELRGGAARGGARGAAPMVFEDRWEGGLGQYLAWIVPRLAEMRRLLRPTGTLVVHCDHHACHYLKVELDRLFGPERFVNEIIWCYKSGGASPKRRFSRKHDSLLLYARGPSYYFAPQTEKSYNRGLKPYRFAGVQEHQDAHGWYTLVGMKDYWELDMVGRTSAERLGYPTQKPERLLERLLVSLAPEGGLVGDLFSGSGTTAAVAQRLGRRFLACDDSEAAVALAARRLTLSGQAFTAEGCAVPDLVVEELPPAGPVE